MQKDLDTLHHLARRYCAVEVTFSDCGCHTVSLFVGNTKITEEDKLLSVVLANVARRIDEIEGTQQPTSIERL